MMTGFLLRKRAVVAAGSRLEETLASPRPSPPGEGEARTATGDFVVSLVELPHGYPLRKRGWRKRSPAPRPTTARSAELQLRAIAVRAECARKKRGCP